MAFKSLIINSVNNAFNLIGDLGEIVSFTNATSEEYNFQTGNVTITPSASVDVKAIVIKQYKDISDNPRLLTDIILKTADVTAVELDNYDTLILRGKPWKINKVEDDDFITTVTIAREV